MDHAITVKEVVTVLGVAGGICLVLGGVAIALSIIGDAWKH